MSWKFENNRWWYQLDFEKFTTKINGKFKHVSLKNVFNSMSNHSWITDLNFWANKWIDYYNYYMIKTNCVVYIDLIPKFAEYFTPQDYQKYNKYLNDFRQDLIFNHRLINDANKHGEYEYNKQCYESIKYIVDHLNWYKSPWMPLNPSYKKPIHKPKNPVKLGKNIILRDITLTSINPNLGLQYLAVANSQPVRRRGRPRKVQIYHPDLYGF